MTPDVFLSGLLKEIYHSENDCFDLSEEFFEQTITQIKSMKMDNLKLSNFSVSIIFAMVKAIEQKDQYTCGHSERVADTCLKLCKKLEKNAAERRAIYYSALLHDVGKIGIPEQIINKTSKLTDEEFDIIKQHPVKGSKILSMITEIPGIDTGARYHHERYDGRGYPEGLQGEQIPEIARIIQVADCFDAMASRRSYHDPYPLTKIRDEFVKFSGIQFDPLIASKMIEILDEMLSQGMEFAD